MRRGCLKNVVASVWNLLKIYYAHEMDRYLYDRIDVRVDLPHRIPGSHDR